MHPVGCKVTARATRRSLEVQPQSKLNLAAGSESNITRNRLTQETKRAAGGALGIRLTRLYYICGTKSVYSSGWCKCHRRQRQVQARSWNVEVRAIEDVEDLGPEFHVGGLRKLESLVEE